MLLKGIDQVKDQVNRFGYKWARLYHDDTAVCVFNAKDVDELVTEISDYLESYPNRYKIDFRPSATTGNAVYSFNYLPHDQAIQGYGNEVQNRDQIKAEIMAQIAADQEKQRQQMELDDLREQLEQKSQLQGVLNGALEHLLTKLMANPTIQGFISGQTANLNGERSATALDELTDDQYNQVINGINLMLSTNGVDPGLIEHLGNYISRNPAQVGVLKQITNYGKG